MDGSAPPRAVSTRRLIVYYGVLALAAAAVCVVVFSRGASIPVPPALGGQYDVWEGRDCLGSSFELVQSGRFVTVRNPQGTLGGRLDRRGRRVTGRVSCLRGGPAALDVTVRGEVMSGTVGAQRVSARHRDEGEESATGAAEKPKLPEIIKAFFIATVVVMLFARLVGSLMPRIGQPRVMGEVLAGILLGPTLLGAIAPGVQEAIFPPEVIPHLGVVANLGLIFYMFLVGLELDLSQLRGRVAQTIAISNTGVMVPMTMGLAVALPTYALVGAPHPFAGFALFMGVSMSITAFPVLARIIVERRMHRRPLGVLALSAAAVDDITAWFLIALATAVAVAGSLVGVVRTIALAVAFCLAMAFVVRRVLRRAATAYDEAGRVPSTWITAIFAGVLLSAYVTEAIGIALIFGAFVMGAVMPRHAGLSEDVTRRLEDFVVTVLLPLFFAFTGLRTNIGLLDRPELIVLTLALIAVAITCKLGGTILAARVMRMPWRESAVLGALMNTRGLTELIVLNLALEKGVISRALFTSLVIMALVTTFMAGPLLRLLDPENRFGAPPEEELEQARREQEPESPVPVPERSILVAPQSTVALVQLRSLAEPLARSQPPRELVLVRLVEPPRGASVRGGLQTESRDLERAAAELRQTRGELLAERVAARAVAFTSARPGDDLVRLASEDEVDLLLVDGRRPLLGAGVPRGAVGRVLAKAPCDVAVLVAAESAVVAPGPDAPIVVPFGGDPHDWAALELGAWISAATGAPLRLLGASAPGGNGTAQGDSAEEGGRDASRLLANASLLVQRFVGVAAEPVMAEPGREGVIAASAEAGLLVMGLSERWRQEGLGQTRGQIARAAPAPILFVRRGLRPGALAPPEDVTRFTWSTPRGPRDAPGVT